MVLFWGRKEAGPLPFKRVFWRQGIDGGVGAPSSELAESNIWLKDHEWKIELLELQLNL